MDYKNSTHVNLDIPAKKDAYDVAKFLLWMANEHLAYSSSVDIGEITSLLGAAKAVASIYELRERREIINIADEIKDDLKTYTFEQLELINKI